MWFRVRKPLKKEKLTILCWPIRDFISYRVIAIFYAELRRDNIDSSSYLLT
jgi:hypothetical protein